MQQQQVQEFLTFLGRSRKLQQRNRYNSSLSDKHNSVAEHSWRLALMAYVLSLTAELEIDLQKAMALALVHDLAEIGTADVDATDQMAHIDIKTHKHAMEEESMHTLLSGLSFGDRLLDLWNEYEEQVTLEAKFIKALDRIEGFLYLSEVGVTYYTPKTFNTSYADSAVAAFDEASANVPELSGVLAAIKDDLIAQFTQTEVELVAD